jgi:hypothetical protein
LRVQGLGDSLKQKSHQGLPLDPLHVEGGPASKKITKKVLNVSFYVFTQVFI